MADKITIQLKRKELVGREGENRALYRVAYHLGFPRIQDLGNLAKVRKFKNNTQSPDAYIYLERQFLNVFLGRTPSFNFAGAGVLTRVKPDYSYFYDLDTGQVSNIDKRHIQLIAIPQGVTNPEELLSLESLCQDSLIADCWTPNSPRSGKYYGARTKNLGEYDSASFDNVEADKLKVSWKNSQGEIVDSEIIDLASSYREKVDPKLLVRNYGYLERIKDRLKWEVDEPALDLIKRRLANLPYHSALIILRSMAEGEEDYREAGVAKRLLSYLPTAKKEAEERGGLKNGN